MPAGYRSSRRARPDRSRHRAPGRRSSARGPAPRRPRSRRLPFVAGVLALLLGLVGVFVALDRLNREAAQAIATAPVAGPTTPAVVRTPAVPPTPRVRTDGAADRVRLGVFRGTDPASVRAFESWLGADVPYALDFSSRATWSDIADPDYMIDAWRGSGRRMVYSVALLPSTGSASIEEGATGAYDRHFRTLGRNLVAGGQGDAILRLGWEFNLQAWAWSADDPDEFIAYWRHVVTALRSVPGQKFRFDWNPNVGDTAYDASRYYPGNGYVDYVGIDVYDVSWTPDTYPYPKDCGAGCRLTRQKEVWDRIYGGHRGLLYWSDFARAKGKPMSLPEWGLWDRPDGHGGGDDAYFVRQMFAFIDNPQNRVAYQVYFDVDVEDGEHRLTTHAKAGAAYRTLFRGR
jgi:hypothetical protein